VTSALRALLLGLLADLAPHFARRIEDSIAPADTAGLDHLHTILPKLEQHGIDPARLGST
jgi:hypothetical protein